MRVKHPDAFQVLIALDRLVNALLFGAADKTSQHAPTYLSMRD